MSLYYIQWLVLLFGTWGFFWNPTHLRLTPHLGSAPAPASLISSSIAAAAAEGRGRGGHIERVRAAVTRCTIIIYSVMVLIMGVLRVSIIELESQQESSSIVQHAKKG